MIKARCPPSGLRLTPPYHSIQAHSARALGALGDTEIVPNLIARLEPETDKGLQMAYASALGKLGATQAVDLLLALFDKTTNAGARLELALCLARLVGNEHHFIHLVRRLREDLGTAAAQAVLNFKKKIDRNSTVANELDPLLSQCAEAFAREDFAPALAHLETVTRLVADHHYKEAAGKILNHSAAHLVEVGVEHIGYLLVTLHTLDVGWQG